METAAVAPPPAPRPIDAAVSAAADAPVDACPTSSYPAPTEAELRDPGRTQHGWFHGADGERRIDAACDLPDRVVMYEAGTAPVAWIWNRSDDAKTSYRIASQSAHAGHLTIELRDPPQGSYILDVILEGPSIHIMTSVGDVLPGTACRFASSGSAIADPLIACSTRRGFAKIDALPAKPCAGYADGVGWPLELTWWNDKGSRTLSGSLDAVAADRATFTYRFGTGRDTVELVLHPADHTGALWFADGKREPCTMIYTDQRRS